MAEPPCGPRAAAGAAPTVACSSGLSRVCRHVRGEGWAGRVPETPSCRVQLWRLQAGAPQSQPPSSPAASSSLRPVSGSYVDARCWAQGPGRSSALSLWESQLHLRGHLPNKATPSGSGTGRAHLFRGHPQPSAVHLLAPSSHLECKTAVALRRHQEAQLLLCPLSCKPHPVPHPALPRPHGETRAGPVLGGVDSRVSTWHTFLFQRGKVRESQE